MESLILKNSTLYRPLKRYVRQHNQYRLNQTPTIEYLGHPINAFYLIRHIVYGWEYVSHHLPHLIERRPLSDELAQLKKRNINVDEDDINGAAAGIARLFSEYSFDQNELISNGKFVTTFENGQEIQSEQSIMPLDGFGLCKVADRALHLGHFHTSVVFYDLCLTEINKDEAANQKSAGILRKVHLSLITSKHVRRSLNKAMEEHDNALEYINQAGAIHRCNSRPFRGTFNNSIEYSSNRKHIHLTVNNTDLWYYNTKIPATQNITFGANESMVVDKLCRGGQVKTPEDKTDLTCLYVSGKSDWLRLGPMKVQANSHNPFHVVIKELIYHDECDRIKRPLPWLLDKRTKEKYGVPTDYFEWTDLRVMKNVHVDERSDPVYDKINRRLEELTGLKADSGKKESEHMLCGNYGIGGSYWTHVDQNRDGFDGRTATVISIIETPKAGGATVWPYIGVSVIPEKGDGIYWYNLLRRNSIDYHSNHKACPVILGQKWICNKWIGYDAQWKNDNLNCALSKEARFLRS